MKFENRDIRDRALELAQQRDSPFVENFTKITNRVTFELARIECECDEPCKSVAFCELTYALFVKPSFTRAAIRANPSLAVKPN